MLKKLSNSEKAHLDMQKQVCSINKSYHNYMISGYNEGILENGTVYQKGKIQKIKIVEI